MPGRILNCVYIHWPKTILDTAWLEAATYFQRASLLLLSVIITIINDFFASCLFQLLLFVRVEQSHKVHVWWGECQHNVFIQLPDTPNRYKCISSHSINSAWEKWQLSLQEISEFTPRATLTILRFYCLGSSRGVRGTHCCDRCGSGKITLFMTHCEFT